jgi:hypothetical protein
VQGATGTFDVDYVSNPEPASLTSGYTFAVVNSRTFQAGVGNALLMDDSVRLIGSDISVQIWHASQVSGRAGQRPEFSSEGRPRFAEDQVAPLPGRTTEQLDYINVN